MGKTGDIYISAELRKMRSPLSVIYLVIGFLQLIGNFFTKFIVQLVKYWLIPAKVIL